MLKDKEYLTVKDVAEMLDTEPYVLRFYEKELNLDIQRNEKGHRVYTLEDVELFKKVQDMREQGLQLKAIGGIVHDSNLEVRETYEQLAGISLVPTQAKKGHAANIDITNPEDKKVKQFQDMMLGMIKQAIVETSYSAKEEIKREVKEEVTQQVENSVEAKINKMQEDQEAKNEEYYRKLDETMREVQKMRKEMSDTKEETKKKKKSFWSKMFKDKNETADL